MTIHSSTLAWKIPWMEEPGRLQSMGSQRIRHDWATSLSLLFHALEKEMATHSSVLAWRIPGTVKPGGLLSMRSHSVRHDWRDLAAAAVAAAASCVQSLSCFQLFGLLCGLQHARFPCPSLSPGVSQTHVHRVGDTIQPSHSLSHPTPVSSCSQSSWASGSLPMSQLLVLGGQSIGLQLQYKSPNEYSVLISFRVAWFDLLAVQGTLESLLQRHNLRH